LSAGGCAAGGQGFSKNFLCPPAAQPLADKKKMSARALLKRKLNDHERETEVIRSQYWKMEKEQSAYKRSELEVFLKSRSKRVSRVQSSTSLEIWFDDNAMGLFTGDSLSSGTVRWPDELNGDVRIGEVYPDCCRIDLDLFGAYDTRVRQLSALADILPEIQRLFSEVFPAWLEASEDLDVESLMTTRVLHWIAKQYDPTPLADIMEEVLIKMF
jgi:hypothetical protein